MSAQMTLAQALVAAQADMPALQRDKINPAFRSKYLSLEALLAEVLPVLNRHGLALIQMPTHVFATSDGGVPLPAMRTQIVLGATGEKIESTMLLLASKSDPQGQGSAITYARRYMLMSMLGLSADEDDDGNAASSGRRGRAGGNPPAASAPIITEAQVKRLYTVATGSGVGNARAKEIVKEFAGVDSAKEIPKAKYDTVIAALEAEKVAA